MTASSEERREVAEDLRNMAGDTLNGYSFQRAVESVVFGQLGDKTWRQVLCRLADLIEPEPERTCEIEFDFPQGVGFKQIECRCSECWHGMSVHDHYCAECGCKVVE